MSEKIYDVEVARLISEGRLAGQYKVISKRLDSVSKENRNLKRKIEDLEAIISDGKKPVISISENGVSMGCECGGYHLAKERIAELEEEISNKNKEIIEKNQRIIDLLNEITEIKKDWCFSRMSELEDRHQTDCIRINKLITTIDVLTERYQKLREIHGL